MADVDYTIDYTKAVAALDKIGEADARLRAEAAKTGEAYKKTFSEAAAAAVDAQTKIAAATQEQAAARAVVQEQVAALRQAREAQKALNEEVKNNPSAQRARELSQELKRNQQEQDKLKSLIAESRIAYQQEGQAVADVRAQVREQGQQQKLATAATKDAAAAAKQVAQNEKEAAVATEKAARAAGLLAQLEQKLKDLTDARAKATTRIGVLGYNKQIADTKQQIADLQNGAEIAGGGLFGKLLGTVGPLAAGLVGVDKLIGSIKQGLSDYAQIDGVEKTFKALTGSAQAGAAEVAFLRAESNRLGLDLVPTAQAYAGLYASAKEANIPVAVTRDLFSSLTTAGRVLGKSQSEVESAIRAVEQMMSKGTVQSQELKLQLGNALPGAFSLAAKAVGVTTKELGKMLEQGQVLASDFLPKFAAQLKRAYGAGGEDAAASTQANLGRIETAYKNFSARIGATFAPALAIFATFVSAQETAAQKSERLVGQYQKQTDGLKQLQSTVTPLLSRYQELSTNTTRNAAEQQELKTVIEQIGVAVPTAITQFNEYGKALSINAKAAQQFVKDQQSLVEYNNRTRLEENSKALRELLAQQEFYQKRVDLLNKTERETGRRVLPKGATAGGQVLYFTPEESAKLVEEASAQLIQLQKDIDTNVRLNRQTLRGKSPLLPTGDDAANDKAIQGLIEKQQKLIDELKERQKKATQENQGNGTDFLFGKGGLNEQLAAANKEYDRLIGKIEKGRKPVDKLTPALRALEAERLRLQKEYDRAEIQALKETGQVLAAERLRQDQAAIDQLEKTLKEKEARVRKAGGRDTKSV